MLKEELIDGQGPWHWPELDLQALDGGLWEGPKNEWAKHKELIQKYCKKLDIVVQAGGACGMYPRLLGNMFQVVYTFEPHPVNFYYLNLNASNQNIMKYNAALGDIHKMIAMASPSPNMGMHQVVHVDNAVIPQLMIDDFEFPTLDLIMLDIERYELFALKGAINTIKKHKPIIICENSGQELVDILSDLGYKEIDRNVNDTYFGV